MIEEGRHFELSTGTTFRNPLSNSTTNGAIAILEVSPKRLISPAH